jgi:CHAD domain-containing protein
MYVVIDEEQRFPIVMDENYSQQLNDCLRKQWVAFSKELKQSQKGLSIEVIHETRIKIRRLRAMMKVLANLCPSLKFKKSSRELKVLMETLAPLRDLQVQIEYLREFLPSHPEFEHYINKLKIRQQRHKRQVVIHLREFQSKHIKVTINSAGHDLEALLNTTYNREAIVAKLQHALGQAYNEVICQGAHVQLADTSTIHAMRIAFKKFRYMTEALQPFIIWDEGQYERLKDFQNLLGGIQDLQILIKSVVSYSKKEDGSELIPLIQELSKRQSGLIDKLSGYRSSQGDWRFLA